ncbi:hypothetical protein [Azonexus sp.]|jgi:hypothetical protein|uniref:hypothetical protein n=1 Tax=Azonexus sp. TaxID=1872668 RepID=UPI002837F384|nr:hypothetical protein [Azonexus sp.]MDR1995540.1 hypothetical protein [Azonexus sp.]
MSTAETYLSDEEIADFIGETKIAPQYFYGDEGREYGVCPFITFYVYHHDEDFLPLCDKMIDLHRRLETLIDSPYRKIWKDSTQAWLKAGDKRLPADLRAEARKAHQRGESYWLQATDMDSPTASARWAIDARVTTSSERCYTTLKITFRHTWYMDNRETWRRFVRDCLAILEPEQCYSGFEIGTTGAGVLGCYESDVMERICADYFYGLDIDHPGDMGFQYHRNENGWVNVSRLGAGLRTPTWCFLLSPYWFDKLGLDELKLYEELNDSRIHIEALPRGSDGRTSYWVRLGELDLYPVDDGVPELPALASRLIRPVRCDDLNLLSLDPWDDDPNPRFDFTSTPRWMARFDAESDWPSADARQPKKPSPPPVPSAAPTLSARPGAPCPRDGDWFAVHLGGKTVRMKAGEPMPGPERGPSGTVIWYFKESS